MLLRKTAWLVLGVFLLAFTTAGGIAESQAPMKDPKAAQLSKKKWRVVDGFRSAKFGMSEKQVMQTIAKDFKISKNRVTRDIHAIEKTVNFEITVPNLMAAGGTAKIGYVFGHKSRRLIQVNVVWGKGVTDNVDGKSVVVAANLLRSHFVKKRYQKKGFTVNIKVNDNAVIIFRGRDEKGRMVLLVLITPKTEEKQPGHNNVRLRLSYMLNVDKPDIFKAKGK